LEDALLSVERLYKHFVVKSDKGKTKKIYSVNGVSFRVFPGETFGVVGESGCGKTTVGRMITCLTSPTEGKVIFNGQDLCALTKRDLNRARRNIQMVFQDPFASLDPRMTIGQTLLEPMIIHKIGDKASRVKRVKEILEMVGLQISYFNRYPHEFSGGQRQRIGIARVLVLQPKLVICDEPVSALDVSVQSQILNLLTDLQKEFGLTYIFIAHGLNVVKHISNRVGVMYLGKLVELIGSDELFESAAHPYTEALLSAIPVPNPARPPNRIILEGDIPSPSNLPDGCFFHTRCRYREDICEQTAPEEKWNGERMVACHFPLN
jgi:oligopeptide/dipeptide ABC transporter ATP-binding protein